MWIFLSRRLRAWLLLAVALPLARFLVHRLSTAAVRRSPDGRTSQLLTGADSALTSVSARARKRRRG